MSNTHAISAGTRPDRRSLGRRRSDMLHEQLARIVAHTPYGVVCIDRDWRITYANSEARRISHIEPHHIESGTIWEMFPAITGSELEHVYRSVMETGTPRQIEHLNVPSDRWLDIHALPLEEGIAVLYCDITDRKGAELLRDSASRQLMQVLDATTDAVISINRENKFTFLNRRARELLAVKGDLIGKNLREEFPFAGKSGQYRYYFNRAMQEGIPGEFEDYYPEPLNLWLSIQVRPSDEGVVVFFRDIDDRKTFAERLQQKQEETERQRAELETIYRSAPVGLALFDPVEFRFLRVNDLNVETIGLPREEVLGRRVTEIAPLPGIEDIFHQVASGTPVRNHVFEGELPSRPGEHRYWSCNYSPIFNADRRVEAIAGVVQEITNLKRSEEALVQSEKLAAVGRLASSISHEINNPLESITNLLYLIGKSDELPESLKEYVYTAQSELSRVCEIATQTLRFHRQAVHATYVTARDLVEAVLNLYQGRLLNSGITVETSFVTSTPILCLENDIRQVLNNLIANAIDAMRRGGRLVLRAHDATDLTRAGLRKGIRITIADTGHGMSPTVRKRIFEPFYTTKELNGTGLGLWISMGIVESHHGRLTLRSTQHPVHHGTIFSLFLPCLDSIRQETLPAEY